MPRRADVQARVALGDSVYNSQLVTQVINKVMLDGKKSIAEQIVYEALATVGTKTGKPPVEVLDRLRRWRRETSTADGVPAYVVFHDATLEAIAAARPANLTELLKVSGVGDSKLRKYGEEVLEVLRGAPA